MAAGEIAHARTRAHAAEMTRPTLLFSKGGLVQRIAVLERRCKINDYSGLELPQALPI